MNTRIYGRFSSKPQEKGDSYRQQIEGAKTYAAKHDLNIIGEPYFDEGVSGKAGLNLEKEFGRVLEDSESGDCILVQFLDRIGRQNPFVVGKLLYDTVSKGITVTVTECRILPPFVRLGNANDQPYCTALDSCFPPS